MKNEQQNISVSVVMCTYNGAAFVEEQLLSVLEQTYPLKEILIYDDVSTDETFAILQRMAAQHPVVSLHRNTRNMGFTQNFEQAMLAATGDAIATCDQDDVWVKEKIEKLVQAWKPGIPLIYCYSEKFKQTIPVHATMSRLFRKFEGTDPRKLFISNTISGHAMLFRKELLHLVLPLSEKVTYDWWMAVVAACNGGVQFLPEILVYHREHDNNITILSDKQYTKQQIKAIVKKIFIENCTLFATAPNMKSAHRKVALRFAELIRESMNHSFYKPLFWFLMRYRRPFFSYKRRAIGFFTHLKHSIKNTKN